VSGKREHGIVVTVRESFGFISCLNHSEEIFFHISEVQAPEEGAHEHSRQHLNQLMAEGTEVDFVFTVNPRSDKPNAKQVKILPPGTIKVHDIGEQVLKAQVTQNAQGTTRRDGATGVVKVTGMAEGQAEGMANGPTAAVGDSLLFDLSEVEHGKVPSVGSEVECLVSVHKRSKQKRAVKVKVLSAPQTDRTNNLWSEGKATVAATAAAKTSPASNAGKREIGLVVTLKESFGFIKPADTDANQIFFHFSELQGSERAVLGRVVEYEVQFSQLTKRDVAVKVTILPEEVVPLGAPQTVQGIVNIAATEEGNGMLIFTDSHLCEQTCSYDESMVDFSNLTGKDEAQPLGVDDEVEFEARMNIASGIYSASAVRLLRRSSECIEYGAVNMLKINFGFIKCCSRALDIFFHLSSLQQDLTPETIAIGTEVQYRVIRDKKSGKLTAVDVRPAPPGCVVFEEVGEDEVTGTVIERGISRSAGGVAVGVIEYPDPKGDNKPCRITFHPPDVVGTAPKIGDPVVFKVATNLRAARDALRVQSLAAQQGARRATQVSLVRHKGWVAAIKAAYGFIEYPPQAINVAKKVEAIAAGGTDVASSKPPPGLTPVSSSSDVTKLAEEEEGGDGGDGVKEAEPSAGVQETGQGADGGVAEGQADGRKAKVDGDVDAEVARDEIDGGIAEVAGVVVAPALGDEPEGAKVEKDEICVKGDDGGGGVGVGGASEGEGGEREGGEKKRLFFHFSEVHDNIQLGLNDEVEFTVFRNPKNKEPNARHVVRTKAGTAEVAIAARPVPPRPDRLLALGAPLKHTPIKPGQPIRHQGVRQPLMPDGSRGFTYSREKSLRGVVHPPLGLRPPPPPEPEPERPTRQDSTVSLNADAPPFIPNFH